MVVKKNSLIPIEENKDMVIRAIPEYSGGQYQKQYFIVEIREYTTDRLNYKTTSHCLDMPELRKILGVKKKEALRVLCV